ncbi:YraN family protein [Paraoerskovia marina]|uniref:YraN family protein n=1 Tax=Paraoerskovia marina TaxID=545619 RepID=UPI000492698A|nr:YraN family protein [Paraoerskovia marina]
MRAKDAVGRYGESVAVRHLESLGWQIVARNWRTARGELDVVALDGDVLVAVEVKTRRGVLSGHPAEAVTPAKLARIRRLTGEWLSLDRSHPASVRIDVVAVVVARAGAAQIEHLRGVW